jgi:hypothetical protein
MKLAVKHLPSLFSAAEALGLGYRESTTFKTFAGRTEGCQYELFIPNSGKAYSIGVNQTQDGYELLWDPWQGGYGLEQIIGKEAINLKREYAIQEAINTAVTQGAYRHYEETLEDGTRRLWVEIA